MECCSRSRTRSAPGRRAIPRTWRRSSRTRAALSPGVLRRVGGAGRAADRRADGRGRVRALPRPARAAPGAEGRPHRRRSRRPQRRARAGGDPHRQLLETFFELARNELSGDRGAHARAYLERRGFPRDAIEYSGLALVPAANTTREALSRSGYTDSELRAAGILADTRWPGRLCGAWRNEWGRIGTLWARAPDDTLADTRYLYLRGASRTNLPPYGLARGARELALVEGFLDYHQLAARGIDNVAVLGGTSTGPRLFERLTSLGVHTVVLCLDNDDAGRAATARAVEHAARGRTSPAIYVVNARDAAAKDPDALVRSEGLEAWRELLSRRECGIVWRARALLGDVEPDAPPAVRRDSVGRAGAWLGTLPPRLALEQEDAVRVLAERGGYLRGALERAFHARYWNVDCSPEPLRPSESDLSPAL